MIDRIPEIVDLKPQHPPKERYYRFEEPNPPVPPSWYGLQEYGFEYRGFLVVRSDREYLLWEIKLKDLSGPPMKLLGFFTSPGKAKDCIDQFFADEERNKNIQVKKGSTTEQ